ncbi:MAG: molybdopterin cofactor-binding domain-containing protein, partial [Candidatus Puniceispirillales bacterium]
NSFIEYICLKYNVKLEDINLENGIAKILGTNIYFSYWDFAKLDNFKNIIILPLIPIRLIEPNLSNSRNENILINNIVTGKYKFIHDLD